MNKLIEVLEVQTYSHKDGAMRTYLYDELATIPGVEFFDDGDNIYAWKGIAPYPCMVAHMDTVHPIVEDLTAVVINGKITGMNAVTMEQTGIGGDDKVGIYVALQMLKEHANMKVFFPRDEEVGCEGSDLADEKFFDDVTIALQCDRRGNTDFVTKASGVELSSPAFQADVLPILTSYGYKFSDGMMTDVMELKRNGITCSMANISCGYYNPHSETEYVNAADVHKVTLMVSDIIKALGGTYYPHIAPVYHRHWEPRMADDTSEFAWWDDKSTYGRVEKQLSMDGWCQDCFMKPATGINGLCDECYDWHKSRNLLPPPPSRTVVIHNPPLKKNVNTITTVDEAKAFAKSIVKKAGKKGKKHKKGEWKGWTGFRKGFM